MLISDIDLGAFEGDITLDPEERQGFIENENKFASLNFGRWPNGVIPYRYSERSCKYQQRFLLYITTQFYNFACLISHVTL